jgi:branched-chain amino acid transport system substrate-binding protein
MKYLQFAFLVVTLMGAIPTHAMQIVVGQVGPMTGLDANQGRAYAVGMKLVFDNINKMGGVNGHSFTMVRKDDGGRAEDTVRATKQILVENNPMVLAGFFGNEGISSLVNSGVLEENSIAILGYRSTENHVGVTYLYSVRASLSDELNKIAEHLTTIGINRIGLFYEEGMAAPSLLSAIDEAVKKSRIAVISKASYPTASARVSPAVEVLVKADPQAILMVCSGAAAASFIEQYRTAGGGSRLLLNSAADLEQLSKRLGVEQMQGISIAQVLPNPYKSLVPLTKEFNDSVAKAGNLEVPVSYTMMEGYIAAKVIVEAVRRMGGSPSKKKLMLELDGMNRYDLGGYAVSFRPGMHSGSKFVELSIISGSGRLRQ